MSKPPKVGQVRSWLAAGSEAGFKASFAMLLIIAALGTTYTGSGGNFPLVELRGVLVRALAFSGLLLVVALVLRRERVISNAALALVTLMGLFTAYVVHTELFHPSNRVWLVLVLVAALLAIFTAFRVIDELRWGGIAFAAAAVVAVVVAAWPGIAAMLDGGLSAPGGLLYVGNPVMWIVLVLACIAATLALRVVFRIWHPSRTGGIAFLAAASLLATAIHVIGLKYDESGTGYYGQGWEDHPNVRSVAFKETPNIYFVGFDSITPEAIMRKHMGIETTGFHRLMDRAMRRFRNLFANAVPTRFSLNTLMALDQDIYLEATGHPAEEARGFKPSYFAGHDLSPLIWLLRLNGYETTSIYQTSFFGRSHGPHLDNYVVNEKRRSLCALLDPDIRVLAFWGYCWGSLDVQYRGDFLVQELSSVDKGRPQFVIAHLKLPGHTPRIFHYHNKDDRERFLVGFERRFNSAATYLEQIIEHLETNDPDAILYVFGDHGALLSQGMEVEDDPAFFLQDRFGILGGVYPRDRCAPELDEAERKGYMTSLDVVHAILRCLSGGQSPILEPRRDRFWTPSMPEDHSYDYKDYLYE